MDFSDWFHEVVDWFEMKKVPIFIHGSTLLGAVRDDKLLERISFDRELNFGIKAQDLTAQLLSDMEEKFPYFHSTGDKKKNSLIYFGPEPIIKYFAQNKSHWDMEPGFALLATFWEGKTKWIELMGGDACLTWPKSQLSAMPGMKLGGRTVNVPREKHDWLSHYFGEDYMVEKQNWHWGTDSCNFESYETLKGGGEI